MQKITSFLQEQSKTLGNWANTFWLVLGLVTLAKLMIAFNTYGTNDVKYWETFLQTAKEFGGLETYKRIWYFNHPPFMLNWLFILDFFANFSGIAFPFWLRLPAIIADIAIIVLIIKIFNQIAPNKFSILALMLLATAPTSIMISGFHGNTDPVMIFFLILSIYLLSNNKPVWLAGVALGMSLNIKVVCLILIPCLFFYLPDMKKRGEYFLAVGITFLVGSLPYILQGDLKIIIDHVFGYNSQYGIWGLPRLLSSSLPESLSWINTFYQTKGKYIVLGVIALLSFWMNSSEKKVPLFIQCGLLFFVFLSISSGFGVQYMAWLVPWVILLDISLIASFYLTSGLFLFLVYNFWSQGFPWNFANSDVAGPWTGYIIYYEILCWAAVLAVAFNYLKLVISLKKTEIVKPA